MLDTSGPEPPLLSATSGRFSRCLHGPVSILLLSPCARCGALLHSKKGVLSGRRAKQTCALLTLVCFVLMYHLSGVVEYLNDSKRRQQIQHAAGALASSPQNDRWREILGRLSAAPAASASSTSSSSSSSHIQARKLTHSDDDSLPLCPRKSPYLLGEMPVKQIALPWRTLNAFYANRMLIGGRHLVTECVARHRVAIVIPYRDRDVHLRVFINHMLPFLARQQLDFGIYVIEQLNGSDFNRGMLLNIGFVEALMVQHYDCFVFTDVDLLPENDYNIYGCADNPRHLSVSIDKFNYTLPYDEIFGGVENFRTEHFKDVNGFSNQYFGWGAEDDDMRRRVIKKGMRITRPPEDIARYTMTKHEKAEASESRFDYLKTSLLRYQNDGLNSLQYDVKDIHMTKLYTKISVTIDQEAISKDPGNCTISYRPDEEPDPMRICDD